MAHSSYSSNKCAQTIKLCELCQEDSIKWRCIDCDKCLCEKCKTTHPRIPVTAQHQIVTIGTPLQNVLKKIAIDNIPCKDHPRKMICLFCRSCDSLICPDCAASSHKKHNFNSIESALDEKLDYLRSIRDKIDANLKYCESKSFQAQGQDVNKTKKNLKDQRDKIDAILTSNQGKDIFKATIIMKDMKFDFPGYQDQTFNPGTESAEKHQELFGSLGQLSITPTNVLPGINFELIKTLTSDLPFIDTVLPLDETTAWINCYKLKSIRRVILDDYLKTSKQVITFVSHMALTANNELLLSMFSGSDIKLLKQSGEIVSFLTVAPFMPNAIHVTKDDDVLVGVVESSSDKPMDQRHRAIIVFDKDGKQKHKYHYVKNGKTLFTYSDRITTNNNHDITIVDSLADYSRRVVVLNKEGDLRWIYGGHSTINSSEKFDPKFVVTTMAGHLVISDYGSHALHVLSQEGEVLVCKDMRDMGIICPWGLGIDREGRLWLGCGTDGKETGAKLHIIKLISASMELTLIN